MKVSYDTKLDFDDVLLIPQRSITASRSNVIVERQFSFYHSSRKWNGIPIMVANMDTTGTIAMSKAMGEFKAITCLHKHYELRDYGRYDINTDYHWITIGIKHDELNKLANIHNEIGIFPNICIDVANGYTDDFVNFCRSVRNLALTHKQNPIIMAGNICTPEMVQELILHGGVDIVKVGIGPGSACTTRLKTGVGYPQLSAIIECSHAAHGLKTSTGHHGLICADGGCRLPADVVKAFAANADFVMLGGMFAGAEECEGEWTYQYKCVSNPDTDYTMEWWQPLNPGEQNYVEKQKTSLTFYGMSSHKAQNKYGGIKQYSSSEGRVVTIPYKGFAKDIMLDILGGVRSACAYVGAETLKDLPKCAEFVRVNRTHFNQSV